MMEARCHVMSPFIFSQCCITFYCRRLSPNKNVYGKNTESLLSLYLTVRHKSFKTFFRMLPNLSEVGLSGGFCLFVFIMTTFNSVTLKKCN